MGISEEAESKRAAIPDRFRADSVSLPLTGLFSSDMTVAPADLRAAIENTATAMDDEIAFIEADGADTAGRKIDTLQDLRDLAVTLEGMDTDEERRDALAGVLSGRMITNYFAFLDTRRVEAQAANRKADREAHYMALLAAQIAELDFQIGQLEDALGYLARTGDVRGTMEQPGVQDAIDKWEQRTGRQFDPNDPDAPDTLKGIIEDDIKAKKQQKADAEREAGIVNADIDRERERAEKNDLTLAAKNRTYEGRSDTIDQVDRAERKDATKEVMQAASDVEVSERRLLSLEDLAQYKGTPDYIAKIDEFIENAAPKTLMGIMADPKGDQDIQIRIGLKNLKSELSEWDEYKGTPDYATYVEISVSEAPGAVREVLKNDPDLDTDIVAVLYKPFSDTIDEPDSKSTASAPDAEGGTTNVADTSTQRNPQTSSPTLG